MFLRPPAGHPCLRLYEEAQVRHLELNPLAFHEVIPTTKQAIQLAKRELEKESRALSYQYLARTPDAHLVLMQIGRLEQRIIWSFGPMDALPDRRALDNAPPLEVFDKPNQG